VPAQHKVEWKLVQELRANLPNPQSDWDFARLHSIQGLASTSAAAMECSVAPWILDWWRQDQSVNPASDAVLSPGPMIAEPLLRLRNYRSARWVVVQNVIEPWRAPAASPERTVVGREKQYRHQRCSRRWRWPLAARIVKNWEVTTLPSLIQKLGYVHRFKHSMAEEQADIQNN
jgi:hypothetical protein